MSSKKTKANTPPAGSVIYKVRRISTGLYFKPEYRSPKWDAAGKTYTNLNGALTSADNAAERSPLGGSVLIPVEDVEVVEFEIVERTIHRPRPR